MARFPTRGYNHAAEGPGQRWAATAMRQASAREALRLASRLSNGVDEWRESREAAERVLAEVLADEPDLADVLYIAEVEYGSDAN